MTGISTYIRKDFKAVDKREALNSVMGWLTGDAKKCPVIVDGEKPFGVVNERALMGRSLDGNAHVAQFTLTTRALRPDTSVEEARARMSEYRVAYLPVEDERSRVIGYVTAIDLARDVLNGERARDLAVPVTQLRESQTMGDAVNAFHKEYVDFLPVMGEDGRLTGVLPRSHVLRFEFNAGDKGRKDAGGEKFTMLHEPVSGFMDEAPHVLPPTADRTTLLDTLEDVGYAIVGSPERAEGIVTPETLFRSNGR